MNGFYYNGYLLPVVEGDDIQWQKKDTPYNYDGTDSDSTSTIHILKSSLTGEMFDYFDITNAIVGDIMIEGIEYRYDGGAITGDLYLISYDELDEQYECAFVAKQPLRQFIDDLDEIGLWANELDNPDWTFTVKPIKTVRNLTRPTSDYRFSSNVGFSCYNATMLTQNLSDFASGHLSMLPWYSLPQLIEACVDSLNSAGCNIRFNPYNLNLQGFLHDSSVKGQYAIVPPAVYEPQVDTATGNDYLPVTNRWSHQESPSGWLSNMFDTVRTEVKTRIYTNNASDMYGYSDYGAVAVGCYKCKAAGKIGFYKQDSNVNYVLLLVKGSAVTGNVIKLKPNQKMSGDNGNADRAANGYALKKWTLLGASVNERVEHIFEIGDMLFVFPFRRGYMSAGSVGYEALDPRHISIFSESEESISGTNPFLPLKCVQINDDPQPITEVDYANGTVIGARATLGSLKLMDLLNTLGALGKAFPVFIGNSNEGEISFERWGDWPTNPMYIDNGVISAKFEPAFDDYQQDNYICCDSDSYVQVENQFRYGYTIQNPYLNKENELYEIPFNEGGLQAPSDKYVYLEVMEHNNDSNTNSYKPAGDKFSVVGCGEAGDHMLYHINYNFAGRPNYVDRMCAIHKKVTIEVNMPLYDFFKMNYKNGIQWRNNYYTYLEAQWSGGVATITMQRMTEGARINLDED